MFPFFRRRLADTAITLCGQLRVTCGAPLVFAGVMLAKSVLHPRVFNNPSFKPGDDEHPIGAQLLGEDPEIMAKAAKVVWKAGYDLIDLNFACPAPKVIRRKRGGFLLNEPDKAIEIYNAVKRSRRLPGNYEITDEFR